MINYNRSTNWNGFNFDSSIPKFGIDYDRNKQQKGCVLTSLNIPGHISPKTVPENVQNITYLAAEIAN